MTEKVLYGTKKGEPEYMEEIISTNPVKFLDAKKWATEQGYDRFRIAVINLSQKPDFTKTINH